MVSSIGGIFLDLRKRNIYRNGLKGKAISQITLDDDYNVLDSKPDIARIIQEKAEIIVTDVKAEQGHAILKGMLQFCLLYMSDNDEKSLHSMSGELHFEETINIEGAVDGDNIKIHWLMDDLTTGLINSRKISVKAIITFLLSVEETKEEETSVDLLGAEGVEVLKKTKNIVELLMNKKDIYRIKEEIMLPSNKPNIYEIIWQSVQLRSTDLKLGESKLMVKGELLIFILYRGEDELRNVQWLEVTQPFSGSIDCFGCTEDKISDIEAHLTNVELEAKPDYDGEQRMILLDAVLEMDIKLYEEERIELLDDVYSSSRELILVTKPVFFEMLLIKNFSKCRVNDRLQIEENAPRILQICHSEGDIKLDEVTMVDDGVLVEGIIDLRILYIASDDSMPFHSLKGSVPFRYLIEADGICEEADYHLRADIEQLTTMASDSEEIEIKAVIELNLMVLCNQQDQVITEIEEAPLDLDKLEELPGIVGYIVKEGDTLWKLAKKYYTTVDKIKEMNGLTSDEIKQGDRFIIIKSVDAFTK